MDKETLWKAFKGEIKKEVGQTTHKLKQQLGSARKELAELKDKIDGLEGSREFLRKELVTANKKVEELVAEKKVKDIGKEGDRT